MICKNRKAHHEYEIMDTLECGIMLVGSEVKSIRDGKVSISEAYVRVSDGELWLINCDIAEYKNAYSGMNHEPKRKRKLLLHKNEFRKFAESAEEKGFALIPLDLHFSKGKVKVTVALAKGLKNYDKRAKLREKDDKKSFRNY